MCRIAFLLILFTLPVVGGCASHPEPRFGRAPPRKYYHPSQEFEHSKAAAAARARASSWPQEPVLQDSTDDFEPQPERTHGGRI